MNTRHMGKEQESTPNCEVVSSTKLASESSPRTGLCKQEEPVGYTWYPAGLSLWRKKRRVTGATHVEYDKMRR
jgi:hypothetical protein